MNHRPSSKRRPHRTKKQSPADREKRRGRAFTPDEKPLVASAMEMLARASPGLRKWLVLNLALVTVAVLQLFRGARSGNGGLSLYALARTLPLDLPPAAREKRLCRLLECSHLDGTELTPLLVRLALGERPPPWVPIVVDQTDLRGTQVIAAGVRVAHRTLPVAFCTFKYETIRKSQNAIESALLKLVAASLPWGCKPLFVMDRGYARVSLVRELHNDLQIPFLIRTKGKVIVQVGDKRIAINRLPLGRARKPIRHSNIGYQSRKMQAVDLVLFHDPDFKEPWYLLVPPNSKELLSTPEVV